jgi:uracil-DNA glycosylase
VIECYTLMMNEVTIVYGEGPADARIMLIGQNPGREEARLGRPFVGRSGRYLDTVLRKNNLDRRQLYITAVVKETTLRNRPPKAAEIRKWLPVLLDEIRRVRPKVIVLMGRVAWLVPRSAGIEYIETYHPAAAMRFPAVRQRFEKDFARLGKKLGLPG